MINDCGKSEFYIMPCTYQVFILIIQPNNFIQNLIFLKPKIVGNFILAVSSNKEFTLKEPN